MTHDASFSLRRRELVLGGLTLGAIAMSPFAALAQAGGGGMKLKISTIGAGREGGALGTLFAKAGHQVKFSQRNPELLKDLVANAGPNASAGTVAEAVAFGDVVIVVVPYPALEQIGRDFGAQLATKRLLLDVSNPVPARDGPAVMQQVADAGGAGLATARYFPGAHIVRGYNAINFAILAKDAGRSDPVGVPITGEDPMAIAIATRLTKEIGFEAVLVGGLAKGKYLVPGTPLAGEHTPAELRMIAAGLA